MNRATRRAAASASAAAARAAPSVDLQVRHLLIDTPSDPSRIGPREALAEALRVELEHRLFGGAQAPPSADGAEAPARRIAAVLAPHCRSSP